MQHFVQVLLQLAGAHRPQLEVLNNTGAIDKKTGRNAENPVILTTESPAIVFNENAGPSMLTSGPIRTRLVGDGNGTGVDRGAVGEREGKDGTFVDGPETG